MKGVLRRRLQTLALLELANIVLFGAVVFGVAGAPASGWNLAGFAAFAALLVQGSAYWLAKLRQLRSGAPRPAGLGVFAILRVVNPVVLAGIVLLTGYASVTDPGSLVGLFFAVFAVAEYVNYFRVQLMYDNRADLRRLLRSGLQRAQLARDLSRR